MTKRLTPEQRQFVREAMEHWSETLGNSFIATSRAVLAATRMTAHYIDDSRIQQGAESIVSTINEANDERNNEYYYQDLDEQGKPATFHKKGNDNGIVVRGEEKEMLVRYFVQVLEALKEVR